jgi:hypothetical protein
MDRAPGRIGFMSTQRRASHSRRINSTEREGIMEQTGSVFGMRLEHAAATGVTAPLMSIIWLAWAWLLRSDAMASRGAQDNVATNSLLSDHRFRTLARLVSRCDSPPTLAEGRIGVSATSETLVIHAAHSQTPLPHASPSVPAAGPNTVLGGKVRWQRKFAYPARHMRHGLQF